MKTIKIEIVEKTCVKCAKEFNQKKYEDNDYEFDGGITWLGTCTECKKLEGKTF